jgi:hypothetical protein
MTIINNIEIDNIEYNVNSTKLAIANNNPIENKLNVIIVISNPCLYAKRYILLKEFVKRIEEEEEHVNLFIVELAYGNQKFIVTNKNNKHHLQLRTEVPLWHKENMINLGVKYLLPKNYKAFAWIDADVEFDSPTWALDSLKILNGYKDIVQIFSHCIDMDQEKNNLNIFNSFGYCFEKKKKYLTKGTDFWHPGYAWAITRKAYEKINGLYDKGILGSGDSIIAMSLINKCNSMNNVSYDADYNNSMLEYQKLASKLRLGYTPGIIRHYYHGSKTNRKYTERWQILMKFKFSPSTQITYDSSGLIIPTNSFSKEFQDEILNYFKERKEDE